MLTKEQLQQKFREGYCFLDGATGTNLQKAGMPRGVCTEKWVLENPQALVDLQRRYVQAGSRILYAPTFMAQPLALAKEGLAERTEEINARLVALTRQAAPDALVAGDLATLAGSMDAWDTSRFEDMVEVYRRQIRGLLDGGADYLAGETLIYPQEAEAIFTAAELEGATACTFTFSMQADGSFFSGADSIPVLKGLEDAGAAAVGFNCVGASPALPGLVAKLRRTLRGPIICKPNAGNPVIGESGLAEYPMGPEKFAAIAADCKALGATVLGGCCGTDPEYIRMMVERIG